MRRYAPLLALALLLAGCAADDAAPADAPADGESDAVAVEGASAAAPPVDDGTTTMEADVGHQPHIHDYWQGRERVTLFEGVVEPDTSENGIFLTLANAFFTREARVGATPWLLPDGSIVFEGTGSIEFTVQLNDPATTSVAMSYKHANTPEYAEFVSLVAGQPFALPVTPEMADMPHSATSRWGFFFQPEAPGAMLGPFDLKIDVVKMHDIDLFPGHPDLWDGRDERVLMDGHHRTEKFSYATRGAYLLENGDFGEPEFAPEKIVPMETTRIRVEAVITGTEATAGEVTEARFFYRGADTTQLQSGGAPVEGSWAEKRLVWEVEVTMEMADSPYASASQWRFMVEPATQFAGADPTCGGCVDSALEFDVLITAYKDAPASDEAPA